MKRFFSVLLSLVMILSVFAGCTASENSETKNSDITVSSASEVISAIYPVDTTVDIHTQKQAKYLAKSGMSTVFYSNGRKENSRPQSVEFEWTCSEQNDSTEYVVAISENPNMSESVTYSTTEQTLSVYNLKIAATYYWTVSAGDASTSVAQFTTSSVAPRNLYVDGVTNVRDLGGRLTENGTVTRQGLIYRCGRLNESSTETVNIEITENGIKTMCDELGVRSEIDLRKIDDGEVGGITSSPLGDDVSYFSCPMEWKGNTFMDNKEELLKVFEILSEQNNYPIIFHCNIGTDRTGMIAFLVNALLGVPEDDLYKDYLFSNFGDIGGSRQLIQLKNSGYYKAVMDAEGTSLSEKTYNCLVEFGVPSQQLDSIIEILSGK